MCRLYLICPECFSEQEIRNEFGEDSYFLTSLGAIFDQDSDTYTPNIQYLLSELTINEVYIFQSVDCNFINQNFDSGYKRIGLPTEKTFASDYRNIVKKPVVSISPLDRKLEISEMNLIRQLTYVRQLVDDSNKTTRKHMLEGVIYGEGKTLSDRKVIRKM